MQSFATKLLNFYEHLPPLPKLPKDIYWIDPRNKLDTQAAMRSFYTKYFNDTHPRYGIFGINPGRFGAGVTGVPFTDPKILEQVCGISNPFHKKHELSSIFIYEWIQAYGGPKLFYKDFYISSVCPLGFIKDGINYNYYDSKELFLACKEFIIETIKKQIDLGVHTTKAFSLGKGKNYKFLNEINQEEKFFDEIIPLPHPRWIMQYKRKFKDEIMADMLDRIALS